MKKFKLKTINEAAARLKTKKAARKEAIKRAFTDTLLKVAQEAGKPKDTRAPGGSYNTVGTANPQAFYTALAQAATQCATGGNVLKGKLVRPT